MEDQAASLRRLLSSQHGPHTFAFIGSEGSGVSTLIAELSAALSMSCLRVAVADGQAGFNFAKRFQIESLRSLDGVITSQGAFGDAVTQLSTGVDLVNLYAKSSHLIHIPSALEQRLSHEISGWLRDLDLLLIDTPNSAIDPSLAAIADNLVLVLNPSHQSITEIYAIVKRLSQEFARRSFNVLVNKAADMETAQQVFRRLTYATGEYLSVSLRWVGFVPEDNMLKRADILKTVAVKAFPRSEGAIACRQLGEALPRWANANHHSGAGHFFGNWLATVRHINESNLVNEQP